MNTIDQNLLYTFYGLGPDPTNNSANEKISRIGKAFRDAINDCEAFIPTGSKGEVYSVHVDRERIMWMHKELYIDNYRPD